MSRLACGFVFVAACGFNAAGSSGGDDGGEPTPDAVTVLDGAVDTEVTPDAPDTCIGGTTLKVCLQALPTQPLDYAVSTTLEPGTNGLTCAVTTNAEASGWCVLAGTTVNIAAGATVRLLGDKPIVFGAVETLTVAGAIDAASRGNTIAAGGDSPACQGGQAATTGSSSGGGYGGTFGGVGGNGESNDGGGGGMAPAPAIVLAGSLRGGCPGGAGGTLAASASAPGHGGGAFALVSRTQLVLDGATFNAYGSGGRVGSLGKQGGGGGGSGGMIALDAPMIGAMNASMFANGGGGAEGNGGVIGAPGQEAASATSYGAGGAGLSTTGGDGGAGSLGGAGGAPPLNANANGGGGGGGGGGTGVIHTSAVLTGATVSPSGDSPPSD
ncbi:hypothetical protein BH11MYX2_BH11MYX2_35490 [soil metagenome]